MRRISSLLFLLPLAAACEGGLDPELYPEDPNQVYHEMIQLGKQLDDPYNVLNVTKAVQALYPTKADRVDVTATDLYVRFLPKDESQYELLESLGVLLMDHPLDYEIVKEGDWYHDPSIAEDEITWMYSLVGKDFEFPDGIEYEILHECYLSEHDPVTRADGIDWDEVERMAYVLTGNESMLEPVTKASGSAPSGCITLEDAKLDKSSPKRVQGVAGVKVGCNSFVKYDEAWTDVNGNYKMKKTFKSEVRYRITFQNKKGFSIGLNLILVPASVSTLGNGPATGKDFQVSEVSDEKLFRRCVVNNAVYDYLTTCAADKMGLTAPPKDLRVWIFGGLTTSSAAMLHHGAYLRSALVQKYLGEFAPLVRIFLPDLTIGVGKKWTYSQIYGATVHEMSHASHFSKVGCDYWDKYIEYILTSYIMEGREAYGTGTGENAGYCEVGEMWGFFMESVLYQLRYGGSMPTFGNSYWFYPQIHKYLYERGMAPADILRAMGPSTTSRDDLKDQLIAQNPDKEPMIEQIFTRYSR